MKIAKTTSAKRFQATVAALLELPVDSSELRVRKALRSKGPSYIKWYDARLQAIAEFQDANTPAVVEERRGVSERTLPG